MKPFPALSKSLFEQYQKENMDPALSLIGDGLKKKGLRDQVCARLLGYRAFEAVTFEDVATPNDEPCETPAGFTFGKKYGTADEVDFTPIAQSEVESVKRNPYPAHAGYLNTSHTVSVKLPASPLMLSILPVLLDDRTPWRDDVLSLFEMGLKRHKPVHASDRAPCYRETKCRSGDYPGYTEMLKLLSDTGMAPKNLVGQVGDDSNMWINQHYKASLEQLNAEVKAAFDAHLSRVDKLQREGYGRSAYFEGDTDFLAKKHAKERTGLSPSYKNALQGFKSQGAAPHLFDGCEAESQHIYRIVMTEGVPVDMLDETMLEKFIAAERDGTADYSQPVDRDGLQYADLTKDVEIYPAARRGAASFPLEGQLYVLPAIDARSMLTQLGQMGRLTLITKTMQSLAQKIDGTRLQTAFPSMEDVMSCVNQGLVLPDTLLEKLVEWSSMGASEINFDFVEKGQE